VAGKKKKTGKKLKTQLRVETFQSKGPFTGRRGKGESKPRSRTKLGAPYKQRGTLVNQPPIRGFRRKSQHKNGGTGDRGHRAGGGPRLTSDGQRLSTHAWGKRGPWSRKKPQRELRKEKNERGKFRKKASPGVPHQGIAVSSIRRTEKPSHITEPKDKGKKEKGSTHQRTLPKGNHGTNVRTGVCKKRKTPYKKGCCTLYQPQGKKKAMNKVKVSKETGGKNTSPGGNRKIPKKWGNKRANQAKGAVLFCNEGGEKKKKKYPTEDGEKIPGLRRRDPGGDTFGEPNGGDEIKTKKRSCKRKVKGEGRGTTT